MRTGLSTHRTLQLTVLLESLEQKVRLGHRGVKFMNSIKNAAGALMFRVWLDRYLDVETKVRQRLQHEQERVERLRSMRQSWLSVAASEELSADINEFVGEDFGVQKSRELAEGYRRAARALTIEIETGIAVCSCHFKPVQRPGVCSA